MKHLSLAARYRPQNFAQVAGQDMVKAVLSRAAAEDRPAAAYLLSGTRGVGKTTIARIFAKALNCEHAPGPEPCNQCEQCRKITQGIHIDVTEIDGASNNGVDDVRSLRDNIGYAPMEGRYKIFIIDEAHMLSKNAFNALLKTLEEPPDRVVFIFATTEAHNFPITIVSRCQHFVFRHLSEDHLVKHLCGILHQESTDFEPAAVRLIARRAAGSVRDGMSLLDQTLALGGERLTEETTRQVLGLAGQELFAELFEALQGQNCATVAALCRRILQQGVDIGFFVRELAGNLRTLFLLRQGGPDIIPSLNLPADETTFWQKVAPHFSATHLHAAWQMALDAQQGIVKSPEPAAALELLLLNLALLPRLLPVGMMPTQNTSTPSFPNVPLPSPDRKPQISTQPTDDGPSRTGIISPADPGTAKKDSSAPGEADSASSDRSLKAESPASLPTPHQADATAPHDWAAFCDFCTTWQGRDQNFVPLPMLRGISVDWTDTVLYLKPKADIQAQQLQTHRESLLAALQAFGAGSPNLEIVFPRAPRSEAELIKEFRQRPELRDCLDVLKATVKGCRPATDEE